MSNIEFPSSDLQFTQPDCASCPLRGRRIVPPTGKWPTKFVIVGEGPGHEEEIAGIPFVGASGKLLWILCKEMGLPSRDEIWVTNSHLCRPVRRKVKETGAELLVEQVKWMATRACRDRLLHELKVVTQNDPQAVIVPVGKLALWAVTGLPKPNIGGYRGSVFDVSLDNMILRNYDNKLIKMIGDSLKKKAAEHKK